MRRTALISLGSPDSEEFIALKNYQVNPERQAYGWASNNSVTAKVGMGYDKLSGLIGTNGEPGLVWLDNMRSYSRMDGRVGQQGSPGCGYQPL